MQTHDTLFSFYISLYKNNAKVLKDLLEMSVAWDVLLAKYSMFLHYGMTKIEDLEDPEKQLLADVRRATGIKFTKERLREAARILHTIKYYLKTYDK